MKSKGIASGPIFDENTFLNSSKVIVPELSLHPSIQTTASAPYNIVTQQRDNQINSHVKILEGNPIVCVWTLEQGLEHGKIIPRNAASFRTVGHTEEDSELSTSDTCQVARRCDGIDELIDVQESMCGDGGRGTVEVVDKGEK